MGRRRILELLAVVAPIAFCLAAYQSALSAGFVFDDHQFFGYWCWQIEDLSQLPEVYQAQCTYRPVRYFSLAIDHALYGREPAGYHLTNVLLHAVMVGLVFAFLYRMVRDRLAASFGALLWGLHPVHTDVVTYVSGRRDLVFAVFFMAAFLIWPRKARPLSGAVSRGVLAAVLLVLAFNSKEMAVTLPVVVVLSGVIVVDRAKSAVGWIRRLAKSRYVAAVVAPLVFAFGGAACFVYYRGIVAPVTGSANRLYGGDLYHHVLSVLAAYAKYLELIFFPANLYGDYSGFVLPTGGADPRVWVGLIVIAGIWIGGVLLWRRAPLVSLGLLWFGFTMLPVSHIIPHHELLAEHYLYIPLVGLAVPLTWAIGKGLGSPQWRLPIQIAVLVVCSLFVARISSRNAEFRDERTFAEVIIANDPNTVRGYLTLAHAHLVEHEFEQAVEALEPVLERMERTDRFYLNTRRNLLLAHSELGNFEQAAEQAAILLAEFPDDEHAYHVMGTLLAREGRYEEAIELQRRGVELAPQDVEGRLHLGTTLMAAGRPDEAEEHLRFAVERWDHNIDAQVQYAYLALEMERWEEALHHFEGALEIDPVNMHALENLVRLHFERFDRDRGCELFWMLRSMRPDLQVLPPLCPPP